jgi:hypothetical protein
MGHLHAPGVLELQRWVSVPRDRYTPITRQLSEISPH